MAPSKATGLKWVKVAQGGAAGAAGAAGGDAGAAAAAAADAGDAGVTQNPGEDLPTNFGQMLGILAIINYNRTDAIRQTTTYALNAADMKTATDQVANTISNKYGLGRSPQFQTIVKGLPGGPEGVQANSDADITKIFATLKDTHNNAQIEKDGQPAGEQAVALQYPPAPRGKGGNATSQWTTISTEYKAALKAVVETMKAAPVQTNTQVTAAWTKKTVVAQMMPSDPQTLGMGVPAPTNQPGPLAAGRYESMEQLKQDLITKGAKPDTYDWFMTLVGEDKEDDAKEALSSFFQGMAAALCALYDMLVDAGMASPIDAEIVEKVMSQHPEASPNNGEQNKTAGLFLPPLDVSVHSLQYKLGQSEKVTCSNCDVNAKLEKTAGGSVGGAGTGYGAYFVSGPSDNRMCPKIKKPVSTFICRYHCLDGLAVDDHQILCGQAIWLESMIDKYSREYRNADGKWVGGYLRKRFEIQEDDGGHPYLLPPGERHAPIHEDAWSYEKRLQEMRRTESGKRGYCETPGDGPKDLYNFDQHDIMKGPKNPQLYEKRKDPIAKIASSMFDGMVKTSADEPKKDEPKKEEPWTILPKYEPTKQDLKDVGITPAKEKKEPWPPKNLPWNRRKKKQSSEAWTKEAWGLDGGTAGGNHDDSMLDRSNPGTRMKRCIGCGKNVSLQSPACENCGGNQFKPMYESDIQSENHSITTPELTPKAWSKTEVRYANGVYRATLEGVSAYGDTQEQALEKLAQLSRSQPKDLQTQNEQLLDLRHNDEQEQMGAAANEIVPPPQPAAPAPEPAALPAQGIEAPEKVVPEGQGTPVGATSPIPEEIQGGQTEFDLPGAQLGAAAPTGAVSPGNDIFLHEEDLDPDNVGHVGAEELDKELETAAATNHPEDHAEIDQQAVAMGAHPGTGE